MTTGYESRRACMICVEIAGTGFVNKGAELMLLAAVRALAESGLPIMPVAHLRQGSAAQRAAAGCGSVTSIGASRFSLVDAAITTACNLLPERTVAAVGAVRQRDVDVVLDASGFAYSDKWGEVGARATARRYRAWKRAKSVLVLLPQAFGPFDISAVRSAVGTVVGLADLVFARDESSLEYLKCAFGDDERFALAPDFTNLLSAEVGEAGKALTDHVVFVPNRRMVDRGPFKGADDDYVSLLAGEIARLERAGRSCSVLVHERNDMELAVTISRRAGLRSHPVWASSALKLKQYLRHPRLVVGSRYHALASALSQATPSIALGWSHKYAHLMSDYSCRECVVDEHEYNRLSSMVDRELQTCTQEVRRSELSSRCSILEGQVNDMWRSVLALISARQVGRAL